MSVAIRTATRLVDQDDVNVTPAVGVDEYALVYDHDTAKFVLRAPFDGTPYALLAGRAGGQTLYGGTAANDDITIHGTSDATRTTSYVILQPTAGNVGIGTSAPEVLFHAKAQSTNAVFGLFEAGDSTSWLETYSGTAGTYPAIIYPSTQGFRFGHATNKNSATFSTALSFAVTSGWMGVGVADALSRLHVQGDIGNGITINDANTVEDRWMIHTGIIGLTRNGLAISRTGGGGGGTSAPSLVIQNGGNVGIGTIAPATILHAVSTTATTNDLRNVLTLGANVTGAGVGAAGLGAAVLFTMETTTTVDTSAARIQALWYEATHATRKADLVLTAYDTAEREGLRIRGDGSGPAIGFYGVAPIARAILATGAGATADNIITALQNLGLVKQS